MNLFLQTPSHENLQTGTLHDGLKYEKGFKRKMSCFVFNNYKNEVLDTITERHHSLTFRILERITHGDMQSTFWIWPTMVSHVFKVKYCLSTLQRDCTNFVNKCLNCQQQTNLIHLAPKELHHISMNPCNVGDKHD